MNTNENKIQNKIDEILDEKGLRKEWQMISEVIAEAMSIDETFECDLGDLLEEHLANCQKKIMVIKTATTLNDDQLYIEIDSEDEAGECELMTAFPVIDEKTKPAHS